MSRQFRSDDTDKWKYGFGNSSDGDLTISTNTTDAPIDASCSGTSGTTSLSATNASFASGQLILIHQSRGTGAGNWELNRISSYTTGTITTTHNLENTYTDSGASQAQVIVLKQYNNVTINSGVTLTAKAWDGNIGGIVAILAKGTVTVTGTITAKGKGYRGGAGTINNASVNPGTQGESYNDIGTTSTNANNGGGGGGSNNNNINFAGNGAGGGYATTGTNGGSAFGGTGGTGGTTYGNSSLTTLFFGSGGGGGAFYFNGTTGVAGNGGGIVFIISKILTITGQINVDGDPKSGGSLNSDRSGSGAGGSVLLKTKISTLGNNLITALGNTTVEAGGNGRNHIDYKTSFTGTTNPTLNTRQDNTIDYPLTGGGFLLNFV
jgi:hypothetical protein